MGIAILNSAISVAIALFAIVVGLFLTSDCDLCLKYASSYDEKEGFKGKVVWIVGGSSGIGRQLALDLVKAGAIVIISARRKEMLEKVAIEASRLGIEPTVLTCDVLDIESQKKAYDFIIQKFSYIDVVVLLAGRGQRALAVETPVNVHQELMQLNYISIVSLTNIVLPSMITRKSGHVRNDFKLFFKNIRRNTAST